MRLILIGFMILVLSTSACSTSPAPQSQPGAERGNPTAQGSDSQGRAASQTQAPSGGASPQAPGAGAAPQAPGVGSVGEGDIRRVAEAWAAARSYRAKMEFSQQGQAGEMLQEVVRPDRERMKMTSQGREFEVVQIGPDTYTNIGGQWIKSTGQGTPVARVDPNDMVESFNEGAERGDRVTRGGLGLVDGTPCQEWINTTANPLEAGTMCIGLLDNLPREFKSADGTVRMTFYDWNASITINPPI